MKRAAIKDVPVATLPRRSLLPITAAVFLALSSKVPAQTAPPERIRGEIKSLEGNRLMVTTREGTSVTIVLNEPLTVSALRNAELSSIAAGNYVGVATQEAPDGSPQALEVLVFPEAARGSGEGHYAWDLAPGTSMTNATVSATVESNNGRELALTYRGGTVRVQVPPGVPVVTPIPAGRADLKPGAKVFVIAMRGADGTLTTGRMIVGKDGVDPPM